MLSLSDVGVSSILVIKILSFVKIVIITISKVIAFDLNLFIDMSVVAATAVVKPVPSGRSVCPVHCAHAAHWSGSTGPAAVGARADRADWAERRRWPGSRPIFHDRPLRAGQLRLAIKRDLCRGCAIGLVATSSVYHQVIPEWNGVQARYNSANDDWSSGDQTGHAGPRILSRSYRSASTTSPPPPGAAPKQTATGHGEAVRWRTSVDEESSSGDSSAKGASGSHARSSSGSNTSTKNNHSQRHRFASADAADIPGPWPWAPAPIRHWWAEHHRKRSAPNDSGGGGGGVGYGPTHTTQQQCLQNDPRLQRGRQFSGLTWQGEHAWAEEVCSAASLDRRVKLLLAQSPCDQHKVCQVLSPTDLWDLARDATCRDAVKTKWFKRFHHIHRILVDFEEVFLKKFDIDKYSVMHEVEQCKVG